MLFLSMTDPGAFPRKAEDAAKLARHVRDSPLRVLKESYETEHFECQWVLWNETPGFF
jgi:hypothetical protein